MQVSPEGGAWPASDLGETMTVVHGHVPGGGPVPGTLRTEATQGLQGARGPQGMGDRPAVPGWPKEAAGRRGLRGGMGLVTQWGGDISPQGLGSQPSRGGCDSVPDRQPKRLSCQSGGQVDAIEVLAGLVPPGGCHPCLSWCPGSPASLGVLGLQTDPSNLCLVVTWPPPVGLCPNSPL